MVLPALKLFSELAVQHLGLIAGERVVSGEVDVVREPIFLTASRIERLLGFEIYTGEMERILRALGMEVTPKAPGWQVVPPSCRFDIRIEADLIEELVRIKGYDAIPTNGLKLNELSSLRVEPLHALTSALVDAAYHEVISYSFISEDLHALCFSDAPAIRLKNPLSSELAVMRLSLWPSLVQTALYNQARQQNRAKLYESGLVYLPEMDQRLGTYTQPRMLAGLMTGSAEPLDWTASLREMDFYDLKADVEKLLYRFDDKEAYHFEASVHAMLHPGQSAAIYKGATLIGFLGRMHPQLQLSLELAQPVFLFELYIDHLPSPVLPCFTRFSKFPTIKRSFAFFVARDLPIQDFCHVIKQQLGTQLVDFCLFDVYQGKGVALHEKSVAFSVVLEDIEQTWTDQAIQQVSDDLVALLSQQFNARLRDGS